MHQAFNKLSLLTVMCLSLTMTACGGGGGGSTSNADNFSINGTTYTENNSTVILDGYQDQTNIHGLSTTLTMFDSISGTGQVINMWVFPGHLDGIYNLSGMGSLIDAYIFDKTSGTRIFMQDRNNNVSGAGGTGGSITIHQYIAPGQPIVGSFDLNLCASTGTCAASVKNYKGTFSITQTATQGTIARPFLISQTSLANHIIFPGGIAPDTGKNYYVINSNTTGGTLTITLTPTTYPATDVNMAVYTDAAFTAPATCDVTSTLNVVGSGVETCAITAAANQKFYFTVSQLVAATGLQTYTVSAGE